MNLHKRWKILAKAAEWCDYCAYSRRHARQGPCKSHPNNSLLLPAVWRILRGLDRTPKLLTPIRSPRWFGASKAPFLEHFEKVPTSARLFWTAEMPYQTLVAAKKRNFLSRSRCQSHRGVSLEGNYFVAYAFLAFRFSFASPPPISL